ncbi:vesicle-associated membrane protein 1 isoform X1 [Rousettus aegyptiacus]|uniref:vesicle-associated membrane protein 1 isoform X1 n=1 Tax=Rousettus aegyptiacus TaxID=9407 RepID=UPI0007898C01|nr:vesicle-associated membrane protein 1 isoform X1 [Rousettus aegyptiacus]
MSAPAQPPTEGEEGTAPGGGPPGPPPNTSSNRRLQQTQAQVEEVVDIMRVNVDKVLKRDEILSELDDRADALQVGASQFESSAAKLKRKYWWKNCKMMIMLGAICAIIVVVIVNLRLGCQTWSPHTCRTSVLRGLAFYLHGCFFVLLRWLHSSGIRRKDKENQKLFPNDAF